MLKIIALGLAVAGISTFALSEPSDAQSRSRAKAKKVQATQSVRRTAQFSPRNASASLTPSLEDRQQLFLPNGRLNGEAFFNSVNERAGDTK